MNTIFKDIIDRKTESKIVYEDDTVLAFKDLNPVAPYHFLIIPKKEVATVNDINIEDGLIFANMLIAAKVIAKKFNVDKKGYRLVINCNEDAGQTVFHLHMHFLAGKKFNWPPG